MNDIIFINMKKLTSLAAAAIILSLAYAFQVTAQTKAELAEAQKAERAAGEAYQAKNYPTLLENILTANKLRPNHPRIVYTLSRAYALNGKYNEATRTVERLIKMGLNFNFEGNEDLKPVVQSEEWLMIAKDLQKNRAPVNASEKVLTLPDKELIVESVALEPKTGRFFFSSVHQRKILVREKDGTVKDFSSPTDGLYSVLGLKIDEKRKVLWAVSSAFAQMRGFDKADDGKAGIFKYDLKTGKLLNKYLASAEDGKHALGDLVVSKSGDVYASDSISPIIYKISAKTDKLKTFLKSDSFSSLQGLTFSPDEKYLFVADYSLGFHRIEISSKTAMLLSPGDEAVLGIDGIYFHNGGLIAIQNGINPQRVVKFSLDPAFMKITGRKTLEGNHADFNEPTLGFLMGNEFYFNANSQWELVNDKGELAKDKLKEPVVLKVKL